MQLEYIFRTKKHERYGQPCVIIQYSPLQGNDNITVMFQDGFIMETTRIHVINKESYCEKKQYRIKHNDYVVQLKFDTSPYNKEKLKKYLKKHNITMIDLFNTFITNL